MHNAASSRLFQSRNADEQICSLDLLLVQGDLTDRACHLLVGPLPEDGQGEDGGDGRGEVAGHRLDVDVKLATVGRLQDGDPHHAHHHQDHGHDPGKEHSPQGRRVATEATPTPPTEFTCRPVAAPSPRPAGGASSRCQW